MFFKFRPEDTTTSSHCRIVDWANIPTAVMSRLKRGADVQITKDDAGDVDESSGSEGEGGGEGWAKAPEEVILSR